MKKALYIRAFFFMNWLQSYWAEMGAVLVWWLRTPRALLFHELAVDLPIGNWRGSGVMASNAAGAAFS